MSKIDKDKLYTVNKWNRVAFMPENVFGNGDQMNTGIKPLETYLPTGLSDNTYRKLAIGSLGAEQNAFHNYGKSVVDNFGKNGLVYPANNLSVNSTDANAFFSDGTSGKTTGSSGNGINWGGVGMAAASAIGDIPTGDKRGMWDTLDPVYHIAGGRESAAGNAMSDTGVALAKTGNPWLMLAGAGLKVVGGLTNAAFGVKANQERLKGVESGIAQNSNFYSNAKSFDDIHGPAAVATNTDVYEGGWFSGSKARKKNEELRERMLAAKDWADRSVDNNIYNISADQLSDALGNYSAFGGPIGRSAVIQHYTGQDNTNNMGAIEYGFMSDYLTQKKQQNEIKNKMSGFSPVTMFALGGDTQTHGADWTSGLMTINAGKSHEENPNDGVQLGRDNQGVPNLVEEGETVYNDYVYSNRIYADGGTLQKFNLPKKAKLTFADISKKLGKEIKERENDAISQAGYRVQMQELADEQERQKQEMEAERAKAAFDALSPEEQVALMEEVSARENLAAQAEQEQAVAQQAMQQPSPEEAAMIQQQMMQANGSEAIVRQEPSVMAEGGHLFPWGGYEHLFSVKPPYTPSKTVGFIPYNAQIDPKEVEELEKEQRFIDWTNYINSYWDNPDLGEEDKKYIEGYLKALDNATGGNHLFDKNGKMLEGAKDYFNKARTQNHLWGYYHLTPDRNSNILDELGVDRSALDASLEDSRTAVENMMRTPQVYHAMDGDAYDGYIEGELDPTIVGAETRRETLPNGDVVIYHGKAGDTGTISSNADSTDAQNTEKKYVPVLRKEWPRYAGLFGPAVGLGMMAAGIGKPDYSELDAALRSAGDVALADYQPIGNYLTYRPMDIWYEQNRLNANARATDRAIMNTAGTNRGNALAGLIANGYNSQLSSGDLYRKALEYNDSLEKQVENFNRGTDMFNAQAYNQNQQFNAGARNQGRSARANLAASIAGTKLNADANWYNSLYGNVSGLFKGVSDLGRENADRNWIARLAASGYFGTLNNAVNAGLVKEVSAEGGKLKRRKNKRRGLTF